jgi:hypothetical protein
MHSTLAWWIVGPILGLVIVGFLGLANKRFGVVGGVTDLVEGSAEAGGCAAGGRCSCSGSSSAAPLTRCSRARLTQALATRGSTRICGGPIDPRQCRADAVRVARPGAGFPQPL